jgi:hypothetical protein
MRSYEKIERYCRHRCHGHDIYFSLKKKGERKKEIKKSNERGGNTIKREECIKEVGRQNPFSFSHTKKRKACHQQNQPVSQVSSSTCQSKTTTTTTMPRCHQSINQSINQSNAGLSSSEKY